MFIDSSAVVAILLGEPEMDELRKKAKATRRYTSPIVIYEASLALARDGKRSVVEAEGVVKAFLRAYRIQVIHINEDHSTIALQAFRRFGKGSAHLAKLNMGDCFSYACAKAQKQPLVFKGNDFALTDIEQA